MRNRLVGEADVEATRATRSGRVHAQGALVGLRVDAQLGGGGAQHIQHASSLVRHGIQPALRLLARHEPHVGEALEHGVRLKGSNAGFATFRNICVLQMHKRLPHEGLIAIRVSADAGV